MKNTFPNMTGEVSATPDDLNNSISGIYGKSAGDLRMLGFYWQVSSGYVIAVYKDADGNTIYNGLANATDVTTLQSSLASFQDKQADTNADLSADISNCVSGIYGKSAGDLQMLGFYQQQSTGRPIAVFNNGTENVFNGIANYTDVSTLQTNLNSALTAQANQNSVFSSKISACVPTNSTNDGVNAPITLFNYFIGDGVPWASANGVSFSFVKTAPGGGLYTIQNLYGDASGTLSAQINGTKYSYAPSSAVHDAGNYDTYVIGGVRTLSFRTTAYDTQLISFPIAFSDTPSSIHITSSEAQSGKGEGVTANVFKGSENKFNFTAHLAYADGAEDHAVPSNQPVTISVTAIGPV
ncbi:hypothetical protein [Acetobacter sp. UBA5411]|uniref:hypothetical protein n=1 Tax=Acetobacter sp. UBA5411 TaxID=1945905 RepID=UPI0025BBFD33|nr:hypothetical protein [Acetobacter sp. UBA5411]